MALSKAKIKVLVRNIDEQVASGGDEAEALFGAPLKQLRKNLADTTVEELVEASVETVELGVDADELIVRFTEELNGALEARADERKKAEAEKKLSEARTALKGK